VTIERFLRIYVPVFFLAFFWIAVVGRILRVRREIGKSPVITGAPDSAHGYVTRVGKVLVVLAAITVTLASACPQAYGYLLPFSALERATWLRLSGAGFLALSLGLIWAAQHQMGASWRIGIETKEKTALVARGLYRHSRNPIYLALMIANLGLFLTLPNMLTLWILVGSWVQLQILIRLEEAHMRSLHGADYERYLSSVRRWL
jgi:protein-S-isoprenylcysteine O-methyltransferase Ste14